MCNKQNRNCKLRSIMCGLTVHFLFMRFNVFPTVLLDTTFCHSVKYSSIE